MPDALKQQLAPGGRLVIPVGDSGSQRLMLLTRTAADHFDQRMLCAVAFVPLIGEQGWTGCARFCDRVPAGSADAHNARAGLTRRSVKDGAHCRQSSNFRPAVVVAATAVPLCDPTCAVSGY